MSRPAPVLLPFSWQVPRHLTAAWRTADQHSVRVWMITEGLGNKELTRHAYPGQPAHRPEHAVQPCTCIYLVYVPDDATGYPEGWDGISLVSTFQITPECPHHGHLAHTHLIERMWDSPYEYGVLRDPYDMDDDERRHP